MSAQIKPRTYDETIKHKSGLNEIDSKHSLNKKSTIENISDFSNNVEPVTSQSSQPSVNIPSFSPLYQQIKELLLKSLQQGEWQPGEVIPSEIELAERFQVSQGTVRKAIDELANENLLMRRQGVGTFVATHSEERVQDRKSVV